jgi:peroxiredoxin
MNILDSEPNTGSATWRGWGLVALVAILVGMVLYQRWQLTHPSLPPSLMAGDRLPKVNLASMQGNIVSMDWKTGDRPTIVYVFTPQCTWCTRDLESLRVLAANSAAYRFVGVSLTSEGLREYVGKNRLDFPIYTSPNTSTIKALKLTITPETILVSPRGEVKRVWLGAYQGKNRAEIAEAFGVRFPDLSADFVDVEH